VSLLAIVFAAIIDICNILRVGHRVKIDQPAIQTLDYAKRMDSEKMFGLTPLAEVAGNVLTSDVLHPDHLSTIIA
jgi:hypothetical protein